MGTGVFILFGNNKSSKKERLPRLGLSALRDHYYTLAVLSVMSFIDRKVLLEPAVASVAKRSRFSTRKSFLRWALLIGVWCCPYGSEL